MPEVNCQCRGAHGGTVVKLNVVRLTRRSNLTVPLQLGGYFYERRVRPGLNLSPGVRGGNNVGSSLFHDAESVKFQLTNDRCLSSAGRASDDEPSH